MAASWARSTGDVYKRQALENGVDSIEHGAKLDERLIRLFRDRGACLCTTLSPALPYALFNRSVTHATEVEQFNGNVVFEGIIACAKAALENDIPVVLGLSLIHIWAIRSEGASASCTGRSARRSTRSSACLLYTSRCV